MNSYTCFSACIALVAMAVTGNSAMVQDHDPATMSDAEVMKKISTINASEIELGKLAMQNGSSGFGRGYGEKMVNDHTEAQNELNTLAQRMGVSLPNEMDGKHRAKWAMLSRMNGAAFDKAYCKDMMMGHEKVYYKFKDWEGTVSDSGLKAYITKYMPIVEKHQIQAREVWNQKGWNW